MLLSHSTFIYRYAEEAEDLFNEMSMDERGKFAEETLVNVNDRKRSTKAAAGEGDGNINEYILVTIIAAADGGVKLPTVGLALFPTLQYKHCSIDDSQYVPCNQPDTREWRQP
jgi:hypothetical protein